MSSKADVENSLGNHPEVSGFTNVRIKTEYPETIHNNNNNACMINVLHGFHPDFEHPPSTINSVMPVAMYHPFQTRDFKHYPFKTELFATEDDESNGQSILEIGAISKPSSSSSRHLFNGSAMRINDPAAHINPIDGNSRMNEIMDEGLLEFRSNCQSFSKQKMETFSQTSSKSQVTASSIITETNKCETPQSNNEPSDSRNESPQVQIHIVQTKRFRCRYCSKVFSGKSLRRDHELVHTGGKKYLCNFCDETFKDMQSKQDHERIHAAENLFSCHFCDKAFSDANDKEVHERTHVGDKPYSCRYCRKSFANRFIKNNHEFVHTGEKPFVCKYCGKAFSWRSSVITHERIHTGTRPFPCSYCKKAFHQRVQRDIHQRTHTGEKPFSCQYCGHRFSQNHYRIVHEQRNHVIENAIATASAGDDLMQKLDNVNKTE